jgi:CRISPR type III-B/RAMP module RAMP protein Cmr1
MRNEPITFKIKTLTPLWTGGSDGKMHRVHETGIIGSIRWWYEVLVRALGGSACDPSSKEKKCEADNHCDVCELFGCTGWGRKFRLEIINDINEHKLLNQVSIDTRKNKKYKRFSSGFTMKDLQVKIVPLRNISDKEWFLLRETLTLISNYGALGGRTSQGNGIVEIDLSNFPNKKAPLVFRNFDGIKEPSLDKFSFQKFNIEFKESITNLINKNLFWISYSHSGNSNWENLDYLPIAFHIRDCLRRSIDNRHVRHKIFGKRAKGPKLFVSHGYKLEEKKCEVRIWGYDIGNLNIHDQLENKLGKFLFNDESENGVICRLISEIPGSKIINKIKEGFEL